jgi:hypothetical protein
MKKLIMILCLLFISGCSHLVKNNIQYSTETPFNNTKISDTPNIKATIIPSQLATTQKLLPRITESVYTTQIGSSKILNDEETEILYKILRGGKNCNFPCFMDIYPNTTKWSDAKSKIEQYGIVLEDAPYKINKRPLTTGYLADITTNKDVNLNFAFHIEVEDDIVKRILVDTVIMKGDSLDLNDHHLSSFSITNIFNKYGKPGFIYVNPPNIDLGYEIHLFYIETKLWIDYLGVVTRKNGSTYTLCPNIGDGDISSFSFAIADPSDPIDISEYSHINFDEKSSIEYPIDQAINMQIDDFYKLMTTGNPKCFNYELSK